VFSCDREPLSRPHYSDGPRSRFFSFCLFAFKIAFQSWWVYRGPFLIYLLPFDAPWKRVDPPKPLDCALSSPLPLSCPGTSSRGSRFLCGRILLLHRDPARTILLIFYSPKAFEVFNWIVLILFLPFFSLELLIKGKRYCWRPRCCILFSSRRRKHVVFRSPRRSPSSSPLLRPSGPSSTKEVFFSVMEFSFFTLRRTFPRSSVGLIFPFRFPTHPSADLG